MFRDIITTRAKTTNGSTVTVIENNRVEDVKVNRYNDFLCVEQDRDDIITSVFVYNGYSCVPITWLFYDETIDEIVNKRIKDDNNAIQHLTNKANEWSPIINHDRVEEFKEYVESKKYVEANRLPHTNYDLVDLPF
jgi:hypothetical protein